MYWQHNNQTRQGCERKMCENSMVEAWRVESGRGKLLGEGAASPLPMHSYGVWGISPPAGSGAEPQPKWNLVHFGLKIWHLVTTILMIFMRNFTYKNALDILVGEHEWVKWKCASLTQDAWALACLNNLIVNDVTKLCCKMASQLLCYNLDFDETTLCHERLQSFIEMYSANKQHKTHYTSTYHQQASL